MQNINQSFYFPFRISPDYGHQIVHKKKSNWNLEQGYDAITDSHPYRVSGSGQNGDKLRIWLELSAINLDYLCRGPTQGYTIVLHLPGEIPQVSKHYFLIPYLQEVSVSVKANVMKTSDDLRRLNYERLVTNFYVRR